MDERGGSLGELDYGEVEERTSGAYLIRTYKIYEDEYGYLPERIYATSTGNGEFIGWYQNGKLFSSSPVLIDQDIDYLRGTHICAAFSGQTSTEKQNIIDAEVVMSGNGITLRISSLYRITTAIQITFMCRGTGYWIVDNPDGSSTSEKYDFEEPPVTYNLTAGQWEWEFVSYPGTGSGNGRGELSEINWAISFNEFSDSQYHYKAGTTTGTEQR